MPGLNPAWHHRQHALGQARLGEHLRQRICGQRCFGSGFEHHRAARQQRRTQLVDRQEQGHVPGHDRAHHTDRLPVDDGLPVGPVADLFPPDLVHGGAGEEVQRPDRAHPVHRFDGHRRLAGLVGEQLGEMVFALLEQLEGIGDDGRAFLWRRGWPRTVVECRARGGNRSVDVGGGRQRHLAHVLAGGRTVHLDHFRGRRLRPPAADEEFVVFGFLAHGATLPKRKQNKNTFHYRGDSTRTRLLTRNSRSIGTEVIHQAHRGW